MKFTTTRIYQRALDLTELAQQIITSFPPGYAYLADQLRRSAASIPLNFAEGYGKPSLAEQRRFFSIARGSTYEVAAVLDVGLRLGVVDKEPHASGTDLCDHLAAMLTKFR